ALLFRDRFQNDDRNLAVRLLAVIPEAGVLVGVLLVETLVVLVADDPGIGLEPLPTGLNRDDRVGLEVVVPGRVGGCAAFRGDDHVVAPLPRVDQRRRPVLAGPGARGGEKKDVAAEERSAEGFAVLAHVFDKGLLHVVPRGAHAD